MSDGKPSISSSRLNMEVQQVSSGIPGEEPITKYTLTVDSQPVHTVKHSNESDGYCNDHTTPTRDELYREWKHKK
jgi:hypothetical protein